MKTFKVISLTAVCLVLGVVIAWQFRSVKHNQVLAQYEKKSVNEIMDELLMEKSNNEKLKVRIQELQSEVDAFKSGETGDKKTIAALEKSILDARMMAGLETVKGSGIVVTIEQGGENPIEDRHIEGLINELKASDAQALCVNDERIVALSEVRQTGDYIMVNGRQLVPPYTVKAIGDPVNLEKALKLMSGVLERFQNSQFKVDLKKENNIVIPGVRDDGTVLRINKLTPVVQ